MDEQSHIISLNKSFKACKLSASTESLTSFFVDSSGRSSFLTDLDLVFDSKHDLEALLAINCFHPPPLHRIQQEEDDTIDDSGAGHDQTENISIVTGQVSFAFEVKRIPINDNDFVTVESVSIVSCSVIQASMVRFRIKVTVRALSREELSSVMENGDEKEDSTSDDDGGGGGGRFSSSPRGKTAGFFKSEDDDGDNQQQSNISTGLEFTAILAIKNKNQIGANMHDTNESTIIDDNDDDNDCPDFMALGLVAIPDANIDNNVKIPKVRLSPVRISIFLTNAFNVQVQSVGGLTQQVGSTLVSLTIRHSKTHTFPVTITNISFHPGHSRHIRQPKISNMTDSVEWGVVPKTQLDLPLTLRPHDAYTTILYINAAEEQCSRSFASPVSITGVINKDLSHEGKKQYINSDGDGDNNDYCDQEQCRVVVAGDAYWTTQLVAAEPSDSFRIKMTTEDEGAVHRGETIVVRISIFNLSLESRNLMLLIAKKEFNEEAVVSESNGYTFGVLGEVSTGDDGTVQSNRDQDLLAIDTAIVLGIVPGQHTVDAQLRFVPLRLGRLKIPNFKLYDKSANCWYNYSHDFCIVAIK